MLPTKRAILRYLSILGPGMVTGVADDDPSGIATYSVTGAQYGFQLLWLSLFTFPLMVAVQEMCARIGMVTGRGLASNIRHLYARPVLYVIVVLLVSANTFNIAADVEAMAQAFQLIIPAASFAWLSIGVVLITLILEVFITYQTYARYLKYLTISLFAYVIAGLTIGVDWGSVIHHLCIPNITFSRDQLFLICAILGTTISPYLFFWQASQEVEEEIAEGRVNVRARRSATNEEIHFMRFDVTTGMLFSNVGMFFVILVCGAVLYAHGITAITTAADAANALRPIAGDWTYALFAVGILGVGLLSIPVLAGSSAYAIAETLQWREGLSRKPAQAFGFYALMVISMLIALALEALKLDPIKALIYSAIGNGLAAPILMYFVIQISSDERVMGRWRNGRLTSIVGWVTVVLMGISGIVAIVSVL